MISTEFGYITWLLQLGDIKSDLDYYLPELTHIRGIRE